MNIPLVLTQFLDRAVSLYGEKQAIFGDGGRSTALLIRCDSR